MHESQNIQEDVSITIFLKYNKVLVFVATSWVNKFLWSSPQYV